MSQGILAGKVAIVTGASRGIGLASAAAFAREGATVVICGRKQETLDEVAHGMTGLAGKIVPIACHVGKAADLVRLVETTTKQFGSIDVLMNNAATNIAQQPVLTVSETQFDKMVEVNLKSCFLLFQMIAPGMAERGSGSIINTSSIAGLRPQYEGMLYSMTKAALIMMTQSYALELGPKGVRVNAIAPGLIKTVLSEYYWKTEDAYEKAVARQPIKHLGDPEAIAEMALFLASGKSSYITGQVLTVDGGRMIV